MLRERVNPTDAYALEWQIPQLQKGQHETFVFLGNLGVGISAERLTAGNFDGYDRSSCCSMTPMSTWATSRHGPPRIV